MIMLLGHASMDVGMTGHDTPMHNIGGCDRTRHTNAQYWWVLLDTTHNAQQIIKNAHKISTIWQEIVHNTSSY